LALIRSGYVEEAGAWRDWLLRAAAGKPEDLQIMYGVAGERRLTEIELPWLAGYDGSSPVRIGNDASRQLQLDVYGEVLDALYQARRRGLEAPAAAWALSRKLLDWLESGWRHADDETMGGDALPPGERVFLPCSFWLAAVLAQQGRHDEALELFERLLALRNDLGLISEEYAPVRKRRVGNFPQAFTHLALVETAYTLARRGSQGATE